MKGRRTIIIINNIIIMIIVIAIIIVIIITIEVIAATAKELILRFDGKRRERALQLSQKGIHLR